MFISKSFRWLLLTAIVVTCWFNVSSAVWSQQTRITPKTTESTANQANQRAPNSDDEAAIRESAERFVMDFNRGDAKAVAAHWVEDGDYINEAGLKYTGRAAIEEEYANFFQSYPGVKIQVVVDSVRMINETTAIEDGRATLEPLPAGSPASSRYTAIHVKQGDQWLMKSVRDMRVQHASNHNHLSDLEWLIGDWSAEHEDVEVNISFNWRANKNYIERTFEVTKQGQPLTAGTQIIGWDPMQQSITSRLFDHRGGHAFGIWSPGEAGWMIESLAHTVDEVPASATNFLMRVDDDTLAWQSVDRAVAGQAVADTAQFVLTRK